MKKLNAIHRLISPKGALVLLLLLSSTSFTQLIAGGGFIPVKVNFVAKNYTLPAGKFAPPASRSSTTCNSETCNHCQAMAAGRISQKVPTCKLHYQNIVHHCHGFHASAVKDGSNPYTMNPTRLDVYNVNLEPAMVDNLSEVALENNLYEGPARGDLYDNVTHSHATEPLEVGNLQQNPFTESAATHFVNDINWMVTDQGVPLSSTEILDIEVEVSLDRDPFEADNHTILEAPHPLDRQETGIPTSPLEIRELQTSWVETPKGAALQNASAADETGRTQEPAAAERITQGPDPDLGIQIAVWPNPSMGKFQVRLTGRTDAPISFRLLTASGQVILVKESAAPQEEFDLSEFASGVYYMEARAGDHATHRALTLLR